MATIREHLQRHERLPTVDVFMAGDCGPPSSNPPSKHAGSGAEMWRLAVYNGSLRDPVHLQLE